MLMWAGYLPVCNCLVKQSIITRKPSEVIFTTMIEKLAEIEERYEELERLLAQPEVVSDPTRLRQYAQERAEIEGVVGKYRLYKEVERRLQSTRSMLEEDLDPEMLLLAKEEITSLEEEKKALWEELKELLLPRDFYDKRSVIMEIRAGTGGGEAALFAADLYRMYSRYAEKEGWATEVLSANRTGVGGFKEIIFAVRGGGAYSRLKYESGVHRVQRVPVTEAGGRIHTSTATVAVLPEMQEVEVKLNPDDLRIDLFRSSGHGGQSVNTTDSAVRITHLPTGIVVACQDERSQLQNRQRALAILRARLHALEEGRRLAELGEERRSQVGTGERSEKIRTYNFPQNRVTDHRIDITSRQLQEVLDGGLDEFIEGLAAAERTEQLQSVEAKRAV
jgi:peptide chain release factor 1